MTSNLQQRVYQHRTAERPGFASRHGCTLLVYYELHADMTSARARKPALIEAANPTWQDLYNDIL